MEKVTSRTIFHSVGGASGAGVLVQCSSAFGKKSGMFNSTPLWWVCFWDCDTARSCVFVGFNSE